MNVNELRRLGRLHDGTDVTGYRFTEVTFNPEAIRRQLVNNLGKVAGDEVADGVLETMRSGRQITSFTVLKAGGVAIWNLGTETPDIHEAFAPYFGHKVYDGQKVTEDTYIHAFRLPDLVSSTVVEETLRSVIRVPGMASDAIKGLVEPVAQLVEKRCKSVCVHLVTQDSKVIGNLVLPYVVDHKTVWSYMSGGSA